MNKNYYITHSSLNKTSNNLINVLIEHLDNIFDCSADSIFCECLEYIHPQTLDSMISRLLEKIKPSGFVTFSIKNTKNLCSLFINGSISGDDLLKNIKDFHSIITAETIYTKLDMNKYKIAQLSKNDKEIVLTIERLQI